MIFVYSTFGSKKEAEKIGERLVQKGLAACVNIFPVDSIYRCRGKVVKEKEFAMLIKTKKLNFDRVEQFILKNHSYDTTCILEIPIGRITSKYLRWLARNTKL